MEKKENNSYYKFANDEFEPEIVEDDTIVNKPEILTDNDNNEKTKKLKDRIKRIKSGDFKTDLLNSGKFAAKGAFIGLIGGVVLAFYYKKSKFLFGLIGVIGGTILGNITYKFIKKTDE